MAVQAREGGGNDDGDGRKDQTICHPQKTPDCIYN